VRLRWMSVAALMMTLWASRANAQAVGVRAGVSGDPNQFYLGIHAETDELADHLRFRPNLEVGLGDNVTLAALNFEFAYEVQQKKRSDWNLYIGAGPALNIYRAGGSSSSEGGFNILIGLAHKGGLFTELKVGAINSPSVKFGVGYTFPR
jgi:hypothetical protein